MTWNGKIPLVELIKASRDFVPLYRIFFAKNNQRLVARNLIVKWKFHVENDTLDKITKYQSRMYIKGAQT